MQRGNILVVADEPARTWLESTLTEERFHVRTSDDWYHAALDLFDSNRPDLIICDLTLHDMDSLHFLRFMRGVTEAPIIMLTAGEELRRVVRAMDYGAYDCIEKPIERGDLLETLSGALNIRDLSPDYGGQGREESGFHGIARLVIGKSHGMREVQSRIASLSSRRTNVLVQGESGTGKRLISRVIHETGVTSRHPFVAVDLAAIPEPQLEKVLFGEVKAKPTGETKDTRGLIEVAGAGTLLLNGITEISPGFQKKLLTVLDDKRFSPVHGEKYVPVRARLICTSQKNLGELVRKMEFSENLFYRIAGCSIFVPPLRERVDDIPRLVVHFLRKINRELGKHVKHVQGDTIQTLKTRDWPGNVRELELTLARAVAAADCDVLKVEYLTRSLDDDESESDALADFTEGSTERNYIKLVLDRTNWDKKEAARLLKISRQTLYNKIKSYKIVPD